MPNEFNRGPYVPNPKSITSMSSQIPSPQQGVVVSANTGSTSVIRDCDVNAHDNVPTLNMTAGGDRVVVGYINNSNQPISMGCTGAKYIPTYYGDGFKSWPRIFYNDRRNSGVDTSTNYITAMPSVSDSQQKVSGYVTGQKAFSYLTLIAEGNIYAHNVVVSDYDDTTMWSDGPYKGYAVQDFLTCTEINTGLKIWEMPICPRAGLLADIGSGYRWYGYDLRSRRTVCIGYSEEEKEYKILWSHPEMNP